jgi:hypothetical protein
MRARILFTDGERTRDLLWLSHDGTDVYCGPCGLDWKRSYHQSGKAHLNRLGERSEEKWCTPLADLKGFYLLEGMGVLNSADALNVDLFPDYSGKRGDAVLVVDSRSFPENSTINVHIGLLEPNNLDALKDSYLYKSMNLRQVLISAEVQPWVVVILSLPN